MPNLKLFKRRSSQNALDLASSDQNESPQPAQSSFRVLDRPQKAQHAFEGPSARSGTPQRPFQSPLEQLRRGSADGSGSGLNRCVDDLRPQRPDGTLKAGRGSGGTTNSDSSRYYDSSAASARHSSSSTLPSSIEPEREPENDELFPRKAPTVPMHNPSGADDNDPLPPPPSFTSRAARAFSFAQKHARNNSTASRDPPPALSSGNGVPRSPESTHTAQRDRSMTSSSYASTAKPPRHDLDLNLGASNFGDDFGNLFSGLGRSANHSRDELGLPSPVAPSIFHRTESEPTFPPRAFNRKLMTPSPNIPRSPRDDAGSPLSSEEHDIHERLIAGSGLSSPRTEDDAPTPPAHTSGLTTAFLGKVTGGYSLVPERKTSPSLERSSYDSEAPWTAEEEHVYGNGVLQLPNGNETLRKVETNNTEEETSSKFSFQSSDAGSKRTQILSRPQAMPGATRSVNNSPNVETGPSVLSSNSTTPRAAKLAVNGSHDESLFDSSPLGPASHALRPGHERTDSGAMRRMTTAQFQALQRSGNSSLENSEDEVHEHDEDEDVDEEERAKLVTRQRRQQLANMSVYRQQMKKVTGGGPADLPIVRSSMERASNSAPPATNMAMLHFGGIGGTPPPETVRGKQTEEEDDDVPLGILQAHGFPSASRPPTRQMANDAQHRPSVAGSVVNGGAGQGSLPPFARRLPADPYFGASLVNQSHRESLAFSTAGSVYGGATSPMPPQQQHHGGLVGVIASEERAKASRRGSPNPVTGTYNTPMPANAPQQMPGMPRTMSMGSTANPQVYSPSGYTPGMPMMAGMPQMMMPSMDPTQQQMQQFMQMQMQWMQNMMAMQQQQFSQNNTPQQITPATDYLGVPLPQQRPMSVMSHAASFQGMPPGHGRAMTMMSPPSQWDLGRSQQRPMSAMPSGYPQSGLNIPAPSPGYAPSLAPSERSNIGMPSRYRPVTPANDGATLTGRSQSLDSSMTLQALSNEPRSRSQEPLPKSTIRIVDKPKGAAKVTTRPVNAEGDEEEDWAEMAKKRTEKKFGWRKKETRAGMEPALTELYSTTE
ncbi:hypothetical protein BAUCODRAFT_28463 [Baudoinia panamericana UAMH 10762]|uniref:Uncharacterized protein n=1 Tax=Baudoinia panamericana (strain UAMH 10762) TaxID=717646 RepID=M2MXF2_BAUPA|nr:uncharacterized protein BAUCODRAFT_28463 [Baudoinia panamericana UAMH 10762]EMC91344.1 hypothetical protein BAUCODRAFT_28463 [Baudoinia panamericana UAMH 10762]